MKLEAYVQDQLKIDLRTVFQGIHDRNTALNLGYPPALAKIDTPEGLSKLALFLETARGQGWPDRVIGADKAQVAKIMELLDNYLTFGEEETSLQYGFLAGFRQGSRREDQALR